jgi:hypothetical protein
LVKLKKKLIQKIYQSKKKSNKKNEDQI